MTIAPSSTFELFPERTIRPFAVVCGIDGAGKTTVGTRVADALNERFGPGSATFVKLLTADSAMVRFYKRLLEVDPTLDERIHDYLFAFERVRAAHDSLQPLQAEAAVVIVDRYLQCDIAYSLAHGRTGDVYEHAQSVVPRPHVSFLIDVPVEVAMQRIQARDLPIWEFQENEAVLRRARAAYLDQWRSEPGWVIDGRQTVEDSVEQVAGILAKEFDLS